MSARLPDDGPVPMFVFDTGYNPIAIGAALTDTAAQVLARTRGDRIFYTDPTIAAPPRSEDHAATAPGPPRPTQKTRPRPPPNCPSRTNTTARCT